MENLVFHENFPKTLWLNKTSITDKNVTADKFNTFFINIGSNLASKIPPSNKNFESYLTHTSTIFAENSLTEGELQNFLITKLEKYGICGKNLLWFKSYLSK